MEDNKSFETLNYSTPMKFGNYIDRRKHYRRKTFKITCANLLEDLKDGKDHKDDNEFFYFRPMD